MNSKLNVQDPEVQAVLAQSELFKNLKKMQTLCWNKCMTDGVDSRLSSKQELCLDYCVDRYIDAVLLTTSRFNQRLSGK